MKQVARYFGTAGWLVPSRYRDELSRGGSHLERYAERLNAVEINSSFYRHHQVQTYARWSSSVPSHFRFSLKVPRTLSHESGLTLETDVLDRFIDEVRGLGHKLAVLLVQLPPKLSFDEPVAGRFFRTLRNRINADVVCEPRHASWGSSRVDRLLADWAVARVAADPAPWPGADEPGGARNLVYFRLHGQPRKYYSDYDDERLAAVRKHVRVASERAFSVWVIFDNTAMGCAMGNALRLANAIAD